MSPSFSNLALGSILGFALGVTLGVFLGQSELSAIQFLRNWQTLITGILATTVGFSTIGLIWHQINFHKRQIADEKESKTLAATVQLPDALSEITNYLKNCMGYARRIYQTGSVKNEPVPPSDSINIVKNVIEFVDPVSAKQMADFVRLYQVHNARLQPTQPPSELWATGRMYDATELQVYVSRLFPFARGKVTQVPVGEISYSEMIDALRQTLHPGVGFENEVELKNLVDTIKRHHTD